MSESLPRRAYLGAYLAPDEALFAEGGARIVGAAESSMAGEAGLGAGDVLLSLAGQRTGSLSQLALALRVAGAAEHAELVWMRDGERLRTTIAVQSAKREASRSSTLHYEHVEAGGARLRSILSLPKDRPPRAAILFVQGISCESIDYGAAADEPMARLVHGWADAGYLTLRVDKRGVGDSEGCACPESDFEREYTDHRSALDSLLADPRRQGAPIVLFGHSVGGMIAPRLAAEREVEAIITYGTSTANWLDCVAASTERQLRMRGMQAEALAAHLQSLRERVLEHGLNGRSAAYHRQLQALDLRSLWEKVSHLPTQILCGEYDWVLSREEQVSIAEIVADAQIVDLPGLDHMLGFHSSRALSLAEYGHGHFDAAALYHTLEWLLALDLQSHDE